MRKNKKWASEEKIEIVLSDINGEGAQSMIPRWSKQLHYSVK